MQVGNGGVMQFEGADAFEQARSVQQLADAMKAGQPELENVIPNLFNGVPPDLDGEQMVQDIFANADSLYYQEQLVFEAEEGDALLLTIEDVGGFLAALL